MERLKKALITLRPHSVIIISVFIVYAAIIAGLSELVEGVREGETLNIDNAILIAINLMSNDNLNNFFLFITNFGGIAFITIATIATVILLIKLKWYRRALLVLFGVGGSALLNVILKVNFERSRPALWQQLISESSYSFPSGHAMASSALAISIVAVLWNTKYRFISVCGAIIFITLIGFSRLYLGVHYPSDILGGWLISALWVSIVTGVLSTQYLRKRHKTNEGDEPDIS